jgi:hypothetical protein
MKNIYLVFENRGLFNGALVVKAFSNKKKAEKYAIRMTRRQKNKPQYDDWGLCEGVEYIVAKLKVR